VTFTNCDSDAVAYQLHQRATFVRRYATGCINVSDETDAQESQVRRHFEELRIRLEQDLYRLIHDIEMVRNGRIKELKKISSELQVRSVVTV